MIAPTLLIADDNSDQQELMRLALREVACTVNTVFAANGIEALNALFKDGHGAQECCDRLPAMVILDVKMPFLDGFEVLRRMRQHPCTCRIPVVMLSSCSETEDVNCAHALGADRFFHKPVAYAELVETVRTIHAYLGTREASDGS
jgi:two-component system response regulator